MKKNTKKIFLIEDDAAIIDVYKTAFDLAGINTEIFIWGKQAVEKIKQIQCGDSEKPYLVLLDLILPDINGIEILKEIKQNDKTKDIIVFVMSNYTSQDLGMANGVKPERFILKTSITPTKLVKLVQEQFTKSK